LAYAVPSGIDSDILIQPASVVFVSGEADVATVKALISAARRWPEKRWSGPLVEIGSEQGLTLKSHSSLRTSPPVGMPCPHTEKRRWADLHAHIFRLADHSVVGIRALSVGVEVICEAL